MIFNETILDGQHVALEPITNSHRDGLVAAIKDGELWRLNVTTVPHPDDLDGFIKQAVAEHSAGSGLTFVTVDKVTSEVVGSTRFMNAAVEHKRVEIGHTFLSKSRQRTAINTEAKLLMLTHAFEALGANRVELKTDYLNTVSRDAILRLGAQQEGILRNHMVMPDGRLRDTVMFSILDAEWQAVRAFLKSKVDERTAPKS